ncbi:NACHT domain-containing protein [Pseudomonas azerbaijanoccidentalis]
MLEHPLSSMKILRRVPPMSIAPLDRHVTVASGPQEFLNAGRLSELEKCKYLVLLGEPGVGKTEALRFLANRSGSTVHSSSLFDIGVDGGDEYLFVDGLDEVSLDGGVDIGMSFLRTKQAKWRVSCRVEAWSPEGRLVKVFGSTRAAIYEEPVVAYLQPLSSEEIEKVLFALGCVDPDLFLSRLETLACTPFANTPLGLKFLTSLPEGHLQVSSRADLYGLGVVALAEEHNEFKAEDVSRVSTTKLLDSAGKIFLALLLSGRYGVRKRGRDDRTLDRDILGMSSHELEGVLDTALFIRNGDIFTSMHRSVQEFLAARYLARAVSGYIDSSKLPSSRALALLVSMDGRPPSHLKPLYAWYAVHLEDLNFTSEAMTLLQRDPECILLFGDSAKFSSSARRYLLDVMGAHDPYFLDESGSVNMSLAGLITEDIADSVSSILSNLSESTHRLSAVLQAITDSPPVQSLGGLCREVVLREKSIYWCASLAMKAWVHSTRPPLNEIWRLICELSEMVVEPSDEFRFRLIAQAFTFLPSKSLTVEDGQKIVGFLTSPNNSVKPAFWAVRDISWHIARSPMWRTLILSNPYNWFFSHGHGSLQHRLAAGACIAVLALDEEINVNDLAKMLIATGCVTGAKSPAFETSAKNWVEHQTDHDSIARALCDLLDKRVVGHGSIAMGFKDIGLTPTLNFCRWMLTCEELSSSLGSEYVGSEAVKIITNIDDTLPQSLILLVESLEETPATQAAHSQIERCIKALEEQSKKPRDQIEDLINGLVDQLKNSMGALENEAVEQISYWASALYCGEYWLPGARPHSSGLEPIKDAFGDDLAESVVAIIAASYKNQASTEQNVLFSGLDLLLGAGEASALETINIGQILRTFIASCNVRNPPDRESVQRFCIDKLSDFVMVSPDLVEQELSKPYIAMSIARALEFYSAQSGFHAWFARRMLQRTDWIGQTWVSSILAVCSKNFSLNECIDTANQLIKIFVQEESSIRSDRDLLSLLFWAARIDPDLFGGRLVLSLSRFTPELIHQIILDNYQSYIFSLDHSVKLKLCTLLMGYFTSDIHGSWLKGKYWPDVSKVLSVIVASDDIGGLEALIMLLKQSARTGWEEQLSHEIEKSLKLRRNQTAIILSPKDILSVLDGRGPINASDLSALIVGELEEISADIQSSSLNDWRLYWESSGGKLAPKIENDCRDAIAVKLRERLRVHGGFSVDPESASSGYTRADIKVSYRNISVPIEVKRTNHIHLWHGHTGQLQTYVQAPATEGQGIYLIFWFGNALSVTNRPGGTAAPASPLELKDALMAELSSELCMTTFVVVIDASDAASLAKERKEKDYLEAKSRRLASRGARYKKQEK